MLAAGCGRLEFMAANVPAVFGDYRRHSDIPTAPIRSSASTYMCRAGFPRLPPAAGCLLAWRPLGDSRQGGVIDSSRAALAELGLCGVCCRITGTTRTSKCRVSWATPRSAGQWAAAHAGEFGADPSRLYLMGHSGGRPYGGSGNARPEVFCRRRPARAAHRRRDRLSDPYDFLPLLEAVCSRHVRAPALYQSRSPSNSCGADAAAHAAGAWLMDDSSAPKNRAIWRRRCARAACRVDAQAVSEAGRTPTPAPAMR